MGKLREYEITCELRVKTKITLTFEDNEDLDNNISDTLDELKYELLEDVKEIEIDDFEYVDKGEAYYDEM